MNTLLKLLSITIVALAAGTVLGVVGMYAGGFIGRIIIPRPNVHVSEGLEYPFGGAIIGALVGLIAVIVYAARTWNQTPKSQVELP